MSEYLPTDLILQIISRLPAKYVARCRCLSKLWAFLLTSRSPYFTELFLTRSKTRPRLLLAVGRNDDQWCLYSSAQPQISNKNPKPSLSFTAEFYMSLPKTEYFHISTLISGLIYCPITPDYHSPMLCNPSTQHLFWLPHLSPMVDSFFGYDPINKQFKVLAINFRSESGYQILNLESGRPSWRRLDCPLRHYPSQINICINGILYYIANFGELHPRKIACFDLNSEEFSFIDDPWLREPKLLVNFKGKLSGIDTKWGNKKSNVELSLSVLEDVEKQKWSKHVYVLPSKLWDIKFPKFTIFGVTTTCDVVLSLHYITHPFYVYFFNLEKNILQKVEIMGFEGFKLLEFFDCYVDYVEDLKEQNWS